MLTNQDPRKWRALITEYRSLTNLNNFTPQTRGQRFNFHIAELLQSWSIDARVSIRQPLGEVDVAFAIASDRYILEAKWQTDKASPAQIADFISKIAERPVGVRGVFLSMSGYSPEALERVKRASANLILLDQTHWEAILTGLAPPAEFFELAADRASFFGEAYPALASLLECPTTPTIEFVPPESLRDDVVQSTEDITGSAKFVLAVRNSNQLGIATDPNDEDLLYLTTQQGIVCVNRRSKSSETIASMTYCHGNALPTPSGGIYFLRRSGVGLANNGDVQAIGGGIVGASTFIPTLDCHTWVVDNGSLNGSATLTRVGNSIGDEQWTDTQISNTTAHGIWIDNQNVLIHGGPGYFVFNMTTRTYKTFFQSQVGPGIVRLDVSHAAAFDGQTLFAINLDDSTSRPLVHLRMHGSDAELAINHHGTIFAAAYFHDPDAMSFAVTSHQLNS